MPASNPSPSSTIDWESQILAAEDKARIAFLAADLPTLETLWAPEFVVNSPLNRVLERTTVLDLLRAGRIRHMAYESAIEDLRRVGDIVIVMGRDTVHEPPDGRVVHRRFTNVWQHRAGTWLTIARHANAVPASMSNRGHS